MSNSSSSEDPYSFLNFSSTDLDLSLFAQPIYYHSVFPVALDDSSSNVPDVVKKTKKKIYPCDFCNKSFTKPSALRSHTYTHTGERPFACHHRGCNRRFAVASNLRRHFKVHARKSEPMIKFQYPDNILSSPEDEPQQQSDALSFNGEPISIEDMNSSGFETSTTLSDAGSTVDTNSSIILTPSLTEQAPMVPWQQAPTTIYHALWAGVPFMHEETTCSRFPNMPIMNPYTISQLLD